jgi:hypothetical protein
MHCHTRRGSIHARILSGVNGVGSFKLSRSELAISPMKMKLYVAEPRRRTLFFAGRSVLFKNFGTIGFPWHSRGMQFLVMGLYLRIFPNGRLAIKSRIVPRIGVPLQRGFCFSCRGIFRRSAVKIWTRSDQLQSKSAKISISINTIETKSSLLEPAWKGVSGGSVTFHLARII